MTDDQKALLIEAATEGQTVQAMARLINMDIRQMYREIRADDAFSQTYRQAREDGIETQVDSLLQIAADEEDVNRARLKTDLIKWTASKRKPQVYGDKVQLDISGQVDLTAIMADSAKRLRPMRDLDIADAQLVTIESNACDARPTDNVSDADMPGLRALLE